MIQPFPKRVLITGDTVGGVWTFTTELCAGLLERGVEVQLATFGPSVSAAQRQRVRSIAGLRWSHKKSKLEWMDNPWSDLKEARLWLEALANDFKPNVVHLNTLSHGDANFRAPVVQTVHSCVCSWWSAVKQFPILASWNRYRDAVEASLQAASLVTAPSSAVLADIGLHYDVDVSRAVRIFNGLPKARFTPACPEPFILSAGRLWDEAKNLVALAEIADNLPWPVYLAGGRTSPTGVKPSFDNCRLLGELSPSDLRRWYARSSIYVAPAKYEPFGLSILEAALSGCALIVGDIASLREIWHDAAIFVDPEDHRALRSAIETLIAHPAHRQLMAKKAQSRASQFSLVRMTKNYLNTYQSALSQVPGRLACAS